MPESERVLLLFDVGEPMPTQYKFYNELKTEDWITENDILLAFRKLGYKRDVLGVHDNIDVIRQKIEEFQPTIVFNQVEEFRNQLAYEPHVTAVLEMLDVPFTGCGSTGILLCKDKALSKKILHYHKIRVPEFAVLPVGHSGKRPRHLEFPLFIKPARTEASFGIAQASLVETETQFRRRVRYVHEKFGQPAIAEEYIEGRELYVSVLGNDRLQVFPPREILFRKMRRHEPKFASYKAKWDYDYRDRKGIENVFAEGLDPALLRSIDRVSRQIYRALHIQGYARLDLRLTPDGELVFLEANPNPHLAAHEDFARSARRGGVTFPRLMQRIIQLGKSAMRQ